MSNTPKEKPKKKMPERKCVGCNERRSKNELVRVLRTPEGEILIDRTGKKSGRGAYLCGKPECFEKAKKINAFAKAFSCQVAPDVYDELAAALGRTETAE